MSRRTRHRTAAVMLVAVATAAGAAIDVTTAPAPSFASAEAEEPPVSVVAADEQGIADRAAAIVAGMDDRERAGAVVMGHIGTTDPSAVRQYLLDSRIGGFILMGPNIPGDETALRDVARAMTHDPELSQDGALPPLVGIDQEGGVVSRLYWDGFAGAQPLQTAGDGDVGSAFAGRGSLVARAGANLNFGIVADTTSDPGSFISSRVLGTDPDTAGTHVAAAVEGETPFVPSTLKHFPGHGQVAADSHQTIPATDQSYDDWLASNAVPFQRGIDAGASAVMVGHLAYTAVDEAPASLSPEWYRILREETGFTGLAVTDDLGMLLASGDPAYADPVVNAVSAVRAGADLVMAVQGSDASTAGQLADGIAAAAADGSLPEERLAEAAERVVAMRLVLGAETVLLPEG